MNNSNRKLLIAFALVLSVFAILYFVLKPKTPATQSQNTGSKTETDEITNITGNIFDVLKAGNSVKCTYSLTNTDYKMEGVTYAAGNTFRVDTTTTIQDNTTIEGHMISDGEWFYSWNNAIPQGIKMKISEVNKQVEQNTGNNDATSTNTALKDFQNKVDYKCTKWTVDNSKFVLPTNVQFTDLSQMMNGGTNNACTACNYIQDAEGKAKCLASLNCK